MQHAHMALYVTAESNDRLRAVAGGTIRAGASQPSTDEERRGRDVFLHATCIQCHTIRGTIAGATFGPDLTHLASRGTHRRRHAAEPARPSRRMGHRSAADQAGATACRRTASTGEDLQQLLTYLEA